MNELTRRTLLGAGAGLVTGASLSSRSHSQEEASQPGRTPHTRFAVNTEIWWSELPFLDRVRKAASLGFPAIEFWPHTNKDIDALARLCEELGIAVAQFTCWGFSPGLNDPKSHAAFLMAVEESSAVAKKLGAKLATVVGGNDREGVSQAEMHEHIITGLKLAAPIAEANDLTLILEPMNIRVDHPGHCLYGSEKAVAICREVGSTHVKLNWDLYHMQISEGDLTGRLKEGFDQVGYIQLADHPGRNEPGTGEIHYPRVLRAIQDLGYTGYVGLECWPKSDPLTAAQAVREADRW